MTGPHSDPRTAAQVLDLACEIQQVPAPTFAEQARASLMMQLFEKEGLRVINQDEIGNVFACLPGTGKTRPVVVSAHLDTVFPADSDLSITRSGGRIAAPGIGDNAIGLAALIGLAWSLSSEDQPLPGDVWLVANVAEEGLGNLRGMHAVADRFGDQPLAYLVLEGMSFGRIYHRGLGVHRFRLTAHTAGGHSWSDFGKPSAVHIMAEFVNRLTAVPLGDEGRSSLNVGRFHGGISVNTIAPSACIELDLRSESPQALRALVEQVEGLVEAAQAPGVEWQMETIGQRPVGALPLDHPLVEAAAAVLHSLGERPQISVGSTDANVPLSRGFPALCLGITTGGGAHSRSEYIDSGPVVKGLVQLQSLVQRIFTTLAD